MTDSTLSFTRDLAASAHNLYRCWTEAALLEQWFAPRPVKVTDALIEPYPGGRFNSTMHIPGLDKPMVGQGTVLIAEPAKRFVFTNLMRGTFQPNDLTGPGEFAFTGEITMTDTPTGCTYTVIARHIDAASAEVHEKMGFYEGWGTATDQLEEIAKTL